MRDLKGKGAVVTGGAGGLGRAFAAELLKAGARVALWDLSAERLRAAAGELGGGDRVKTFEADVTDRAAVRAAAARTAAELGDADLLFNNAGIVTPGDFLDADEDGLARTVDVNLSSYLWTTRAFLPGMIERGRGHLVHVASSAGLTGVPGMAVYSASKHGVVGFGESLRLELRKKRAPVGTTIVCPGFIATGMFDGCEPPVGMRWLQAAEVARWTLDAVRSGRPYVLEPAIVKLIPALKILPRSWTDALNGLLGVDRALEGLRGR